MRKILDISTTAKEPRTISIFKFDTIMPHTPLSHIITAYRKRLIPHEIPAKKLTEKDVHY